MLNPKDVNEDNALDLSIAHWAEHSLATTPPSLDDTTNNGCALCVMYANDADETCRLCPIKLKENPNQDDYWEGCDGSPWLDAFLEGEDWRRKPDSADAGKAFRTAAKSMHDYLVSLHHDYV